MADHTISIANTLNFLGAGPASLWNTMEWEETWGFGTVDFITSVFKLITNTQSFSDALEKKYLKQINNSQTIDGEATDQILMDSAGYKYIWTRPSTDADDRSNTQWTEVT